MTDTPGNTPDPDRPNEESGLSVDEQLDAILAAAGAEDAFNALDQAAGKDAPEPGEAKKSQATRLVELANCDFRMVRGSDGKTYAVPLGGPHVALSLRSEHGLRMRLAAAYHAETESVAGGSALSDALAVLEGQAADRDPEPVGLRVAWHEGNLVLDLGSADGKCIVISPESGTCCRNPRCSFAAPG